LDPLSELVKIEPANIGVGLYQHDVKAKHLEASREEGVESCVYYVGVDVNTASPALLRYVSGLNQLTARRVYEYRREHGPFRNREQLREVAGFGEATFVQAAGFLKIGGGDNPLDATWIHPESYVVAAKVLEQFSGKAADLADKEAAAVLAQRMAEVKLDELAKNLAASGVKIAAERPAPQATEEVRSQESGDRSQETEVRNQDSEVTTQDSGLIGTLTLQDILVQLVRPGRDPREDLPPPVFKHGILKLEDLSPGMELTGTVLNVVDFGCFVDIGMHDSGLVHVSRMADRFIRDPHEIVAVGDTVHVWVMEVDKERRRVSLTMVRPGSERLRRPPRGESGSAEHGPHDGRERASGRRGDRPPRSGQDRHGGRPQGDSQAGGPAPAQSQGQEGRPQGGRPYRGRRPPPTGASSGGRPTGDGGQGTPGGPPRGDRRGYGGPPPRRPRPQGGGHGGSREFKPKPGPIIPISDEMKKGKEPMRTFGDLMQFFEAKTEDKKPPKKDQKTKDAQTRPPASDSQVAPPAGDAVGEAAPPAVPPPPDKLPVEDAVSPASTAEAQAMAADSPVEPEAAAADLPAPTDEVPRAAGAGE
jgi:uncharacterized protein